MKKRSLILLPLAAALALTGCSGEAEETPAAGEETTSQASAPAAEESAPATEESAPAAAGVDGVLTGEQATAIVKSIVGDDENAMVLDTDALSAQIPQSEQLIEQMNIEPAQCAELVSQQSQTDLSGMNIAVGVIADVPDMGAVADGEELPEMKTLSVSVSGIEDADRLAQFQDAVENGDLQGCDKFSMEQMGLKISAEATILDGDSDADATMVSKTVTNIDTGSAEMEGIPAIGATTAYQIQGLVGPNTVVISSSSNVEVDEAETIADLTEKLNAAVAEIKSTLG